MHSFLYSRHIKLLHALLYFQHENHRQKSFSGFFHLRSAVELLNGLSTCSYLSTKASSLRESEKVLFHLQFGGFFMLTDELKGGKRKEKKDDEERIYINERRTAYTFTSLSKAADTL